MSSNHDISDSNSSTIIGRYGIIDGKARPRMVHAPGNTATIVIQMNDAITASNTSSNGTTAS